MAKYQRFRKYSRRNRGRWSANIKNINQLLDVTTTQSSFGDSIDLCLNPVQDSLTVSQQYTTKNIELSAFIECPDAELANIENLEHYIMYVPQGMNLTTDYNLEHPEYIMAYYFQGNPVPDAESTGYRLKIKTRMARRLNTGDRIIYFYKGLHTASTNVQLRIRGLVRWWTKAN